MNFQHQLNACTLLWARTGYIESIWNKLQSWCIEFMQAWTSWYDPACHETVLMACILLMLRKCEIMIPATMGSSRTLGQNCSVKMCLILFCMIWWRPVSFLAKLVMTHGFDKNEMCIPSALSPFMKSVFSHSTCFAMSISMIFTTTVLRQPAISVMFGKLLNACRKAGDAMIVFQWTILCHRPSTIGGDAKTKYKLQGLI